MINRAWRRECSGSQNPEHLPIESMTDYLEQQFAKLG